jgi:hypothetical protein
MMPKGKLILNKSDLVRQRTEKCKNHSHKVKLKISEVIFINDYWNLGYMSVNSSWKINPNGATLVDSFGPLTKLTQKP